MELHEMVGTMPFAVGLGVTITAADATGVEGTLDWAADRCTIGGALHGGVLMSLADSLGAVCAFLNLPPGAAGTSTIESKTNFFRAVREGSVTGRSTPVHAGRTTIAVQTELRDDAGKLVAMTTQTQAVLTP
jgi:uncharacterized protein (TIGR00369 family)